MVASADVALLCAARKRLPSWEIDGAGTGIERHPRRILPGDVENTRSGGHPACRHVVQLAIPVLQAKSASSEEQASSFTVAAQLHVAIGRVLGQHLLHELAAQPGTAVLVVDEENPEVSEQRFAADP